jgi:hypothetical protein
MKLERSNVEFAIWRKKVDKSLFEHNGTTIPEWACRMWKLKQLYGDITSRRDPRSAADVTFEGKMYSAWVTTAPHGRSTPAFRLWYDQALSIELKKTFLMSYMRSLEGSLNSKVDVEKNSPFWEFLDIEFNPGKRQFRFVAYYTVQASFPQLFKRLVGSPAMRRVEDELQGKPEVRIHKQNWRPRGQLEYELGARNVIYMLIDSESKLAYVGEARDLVKRLLQPHNSIPNWDFFRYDVLPDVLAPFRVALERMLIRDIASVLFNHREIRWHDISGYTLVNDKIDA